MQQEIILGIGGVRALKALGIEPAVFHLNEGHAGVRRAAAHPRSHRAAARASTTRSRKSGRRRCSRRTRRCRPATTRFRSTSSKSISPAAGARSARNRDRFLALGSHDNGGGAQFNMTALALRSAGAVNARQPAARRSHARDVGADVAGRAGGRASGRRRSPTACTCRRGSPRTSPTSSPGTSAPDWLERHDDPALWDAVLGIPDEELWAVRQALRRYLFTFVRERARQRWTKSASAHRASSPPARCSIPTRSRSASRAASPATSGPS